MNRRAIPANAAETMWHAADGWPIRRIDWQASTPPRGSLLFLPGRGDHYEKNLETLAYFAAQGWRVTSIDWRGQGGSQRLLNDRGRADAARIGAQIRALRLPVGEVLASPYCRTTDHAQRMMGRVEPRLAIREAQGGDYQGLKQLLAAPVPAGSNRWIVGHGIPFRAVAGPPHLAEGEAVVIRPTGTGWTVVARLRVDDWAGLVAAR